MFTYGISIINLHTVTDAITELGEFALMIKSTTRSNVVLESVIKNSIPKISI
jgi:hypothetical protein